MRDGPILVGVGQVERDLAEAIRAALTPDLLAPRYRSNPRAHCYVASEAFFHAAGGKADGWRVRRMPIPDGQHWWIEGDGGRLVDLTADQFDDPVDHSLGRGAAFLTPRPSARARVVLDRIGRGALPPAGRPRPGLLLAYASHRAVRQACLEWHYAGVVPVGKLIRIGVWEDGVFKGVLVYSRGASAPLARSWGLRPTEIAEITRIALRDHDAPVSRMIAISVRMIRRSNPGLRLLVSFADPAQGHHGGVYQAAGWSYVGLSDATKEYRIDGRWHHTRSAVVKGRKMGVRYRSAFEERTAPPKFVTHSRSTRRSPGLVASRREANPKRAADSTGGTRRPVGTRRFDSDPAASDAALLRDDLEREPLPQARGEG